MKRYAKSLLGLIGISAILLCVVSSAPAADSLVVQSFGEITTPPFDTADAERVRIWLPIERGGQGRVRINILDSLNHIVRRLVDRPLPSGYYNLYWNKKDDQGRFVGEGTYKYVADDGGRRSYGELEARFHRWELSSRLVASDTVGDMVILHLYEDSALVSATVLNRRRRTIDQPFTDSLMRRGEHELLWIPPQRGYGSVYLLQIEVGGYVHPSVSIRAARSETDQTD